MTPRLPALIRYKEHTRSAGATSRSESIQVFTEPESGLVIALIRLYRVVPQDGRVHGRTFSQSWIGNISFGISGLSWSQGG